MAAHAKTSAALDNAAVQRTALHAAAANLEREAHELQHIVAVCDSDAEILRERIAMAEGVIQECRTRGLPDVDSMVVAGSVVETQLYDLVAEDQAIEDTLYVLGKALDKERIPLDVFLKVSPPFSLPYCVVGTDRPPFFSACADACQRAVSEAGVDW